MATASIGKAIVINDKTADSMIEAFKKPFKKVNVEPSLVDTKIDAELINKLKKS